MDFFNQVETSGEFQGMKLTGQRASVMSVGETFVNKIKIEMKKRFPEKDMQVMKDIASILDPKHLPIAQEEIKSHGMAELDRLLSHFTNLNAETTKSSFRQFKSLISSHRKDKLPAMCRYLITQCNDIFPEFCFLAQVCVAIPLSSVPCERGFSAQNIIHTAMRSKLSMQSVENKMFIKYNCKRADHDERILILESCKRFNEQKDRRK